MADNYVRNFVPRKDNGEVDTRVRAHHGWTGVIFVLGIFLPPLAVAARFGIGKDFFINVVCTICGYFPGHGHNFFIQNIRNNDNKASRTPKWAKRYGLVDDSAERRKKKKTQWRGRYNDQLPERRLYDDQGNPTTYDFDHRFEDGDNGGAARRRAEAKRNGSLTEQDQYYNADPAPSSSRNEWAGDAYDQRRNGSRSSLGSGRVGPDGPLPGSGDRAARSKGKKGKNLFGRKKREGDEHAMGGGADYVDPSRRNGYGDDGSSYGRPASTHDDDDDEGPEDPDANYGRAAAANPWGASKPAANGSQKRLPEAPRHEPQAPQGAQRPVDIMDDNHQW